MYSKFRKFRKGHTSLQVWDMFAKESKQKAGPVEKKAHSVPKEQLCSKLIGKDDEFSVFENEHMDEVARIVDILLKAPFDEFISICADLRKELNEQLYVYCVSVASSHRKDTKRMRIPPIYQSQAKDFFKDKNKKYSEETEGDGPRPAPPTEPEEEEEPQPPTPVEPKPPTPKPPTPKPPTPVEPKPPTPKPPTPVEPEPKPPTPKPPTPVEPEPKPPAPKPPTPVEPEPKPPTPKPPTPVEPEPKPPTPKPPTPVEPEPKPPTPKPPTPVEPEPKPPTPKPPTPVEPEPKPPTPKPPTPVEPEPKPPTPKPPTPVEPEPKPPTPKPPTPVIPTPPPPVATPVPVSEEVLEYFREDVCLNSHHWHWHVVYPTRINGVVLDRRGELFFHMHRQMLARYDAERLSNDMEPVQAFDDYTEPLLGYDPELAYRFTRYPVRRANLPLPQDDVEELNDLTERALRTLDDSGVTIDDYGTTVERGIHNRGHVLISRVGNVRRTGRPRGVMLYTQTAIRDPIFFRWHKNVDNIIQVFLDRAQPYTLSELTWPGMEVERVEILNEARTATVNELKTFTNTTEIDLSFSLDLRTEHSRGITETVTHMDHDKFSYQIHVRNNTGQPQWATVRIFMIPIKDENGQDVTMRGYTVRTIEMDRFTHRVPVGGHTFVRSSSESSVVIPWEQSFAVLYNNIDDESNPDQENEEDYCGCGWPEHLQIPKGKPEGMPFRIIVMITNWEDDKVYRENVAPTKPEDLIIINDDDEPVTCKNAASYCGRRGLRYPDKRAMGFPFDKPLRDETLDEFISDKANFKYTDISIRHT